MHEAVAAQVGRHAEALPAAVAAKGLLSSVHATVHQKAAAAGEAIPTLLAGVGALTCVGPQVSGEATPLAECLPTDAAGERLQTSVDGQLVDADAAARGEAFRTGRTFKGFVPQVDSLVSREVTGFRELLPALRTPELPVCPLTRQSVLSQAASRRQCLTAGRTCERDTAGCPVRPEVAAGAEHLPAVRTPVRSLLVVDSELMDSDAAASGEAFPTDGTGEGRGSAVDPQVSCVVGPSVGRCWSVSRLAGHTCRSVRLAAQLHLSVSCACRGAADLPRSLC